MFRIKLNNTLFAISNQVLVKELNLIKNSCRMDLVLSLMQYQMGGFPEHQAPTLLESASHANADTHCRTVGAHKHTHLGYDDAETHTAQPLPTWEALCCWADAVCA